VAAWRDVADEGAKARTGGWDGVVAGLAEVLTMIMVDEVTLAGSRCGPFAPALRLLERGLVDVAPLIQARYPLNEALAAFEHASHPGTLKVLVDLVIGH